MNPDDTSIRKHPTLATLCAEHIRRVQLLFHEFYSGKVSMQEYRRRSRELTQQLVNEISEAGYKQ